MNDSIKTVKIAVIGGDARQYHLAELLAAGGHTVTTYGIDPTPPGVIACGSAREAAESCRAVIFPVKPKESINDHIEKIHPDGGAVIFSWSPCCDAVADINARGWESYDFAADEALTVRNAHLTAEGALSLFMNEKDTAVLGSRILVTGSGRVAKCVCRAFSSLGANVTMMARSKGNLAWAELSGWGTVDLKDEHAHQDTLASDHDAIINTVPIRLLTGAALNAVPSGTLVIDLASAPYGVDIGEASARGVNVIRAGGVPGKYAPASAAALIADCVRRRIGGSTT